MAGRRVLSLLASLTLLGAGLAGSVVAEASSAGAQVVCDTNCCPKYPAGVVPAGSQDNCCPTDSSGVAPAVPQDNCCPTDHPSVAPNDNQGGDSNCVIVPPHITTFDPPQVPTTPGNYIGPPPTSPPPPAPAPVAAAAVVVTPTLTG